MFRAVPPQFLARSLVGSRRRGSGRLLQLEYAMADLLDVVVLPRSQELERLMEEHKLNKTVLMCVHHTASAPS